MPLNTSHPSTATQPRRAATTARPKLGLAIASAGLLLAPLVLASPAGARPTSDRGDTVVADGADRATSPAPITDRRSDRPQRDLEVLKLRCELADPAPDDTRLHIGCRWRAAEHPAAAGYQLWRIVDRGERELVARGGLDMGGARDVVSADAHLVRYAVIAVNENGRRVGQSRVIEIVLDDDRNPVRDAQLERRRER